MRSPFWLVIFSFVLLSTESVRGQSHFLGCATSTGNNATIIIPASARPIISDDSLQVGDEIAVYTPDGICAGTATWTGSSMALVAWGDDPYQTERDGFGPDEAIQLRIWDASTGAEYGSIDPVVVTLSDAKQYYRTVFSYASDAIFVLEQVSISRVPE